MMPPITRTVPTDFIVAASEVKAVIAVVDSPPDIVVPKTWIKARETLLPTPVLMVVVVAADDRWWNKPNIFHQNAFFSSRILACKAGQT